MDLSEIKQVQVPRRRSRRVGRGSGSGRGKTAGRGQKGYWARKGKGGQMGWMEGGQMPFYRRIPKRGFSNALYRKRYAVINLSALAACADGVVVDVDYLRARGMVAKHMGDGLKVLGGGKLERRLTVKAQKFSRSAQRKIAEAGGSAEVVPLRRSAAGAS